jgi:hypothetical protein
MADQPAVHVTTSISCVCNMVNRWGDGWWRCPKLGAMCLWPWLAPTCCCQEDVADKCTIDKCTNIPKASFPNLYPLTLIDVGPCHTAFVLGPAYLLSPCSPPMALQGLQQLRCSWSVKCFVGCSSKEGIGVAANPT